MTRKPYNDFFDEPPDDAPWEDDGDPNAKPDPEKDAQDLHRARLEMGLPPMDGAEEFEDPLGERDFPDTVPVDEVTGQPLADLAEPPRPGVKPNPDNPNRKYENVEIDPETDEPFRVGEDGVKRKVRYKGWVRVMERTTRMRFIAALEKFGTWIAAADAIGASVGQCRFYARTVPAFGEQCKNALERYAGTLREEAWRRAVKGVKKPVIGGKDKDVVVAWETNYSDALLMMLVKGTDRTMSEKHMTVTHEGQVNHAHVHLQIDPQKLRALPKEERNQLRGLLEKLRPDPTPQERVAALPMGATNEQKQAALSGNAELIPNQRAREAKRLEEQRQAEGRVKSEKHSKVAKAGHANKKETP